MESTKVNKEIFLEIAREKIKRKGVEDVLGFLEKSDFFTAPASTQYHDSIEGGLCYHSVMVYEELLKETGTKFLPETLAIVALLHDICKIGFYKVSSRNVKDEKTGKWNSVPYYSVDDSFPLGHGEKSVIMLMDLMKLTAPEIMAIRWHMGGFEPKENYSALSKAYNEFPLAVYLQIADMKATYLKEKG